LIHKLNFFFEMLKYSLMIIVLTAVNWRNSVALFSALLITFIRINGRWTGQNRKGLKKKGFRFYLEAFQFIS
jgi:hypothetical protein